MKRVQQSKSRDTFAGRIEYSFQYTDDNRISDSEIRKEEVEINHSLPVHLVQKYNIFNVKELVQTQKQTTLGQVSVSVTLRGRRGTALSAYITRAKEILTAAKPSTSDSYLDSCDYQISPDSNEFSLSAGFIYVGAHKTRDDVRLG